MANTSYDFDVEDFDFDDTGSYEELESVVYGQANQSDTSNNNNDDDDNNKSNKNNTSSGYDEEDLRKALFNNSFNQDDDDQNDDEDDDEEGDKQNTNDDDSKNEQLNDNNQEDNDDSDELDILSLLRSENLLYVPDDFDGEFNEETLDRLKEYTFEVRDKEIIESRREELSQDPYKLMLYDYFMTNPSEADVPKFIDTQEQLKHYQNLDVSSENIQKQLLREYLLEGLDPNIPSNKMRIDRIDQDVDDIMTNYEGSEKAKEAQDYFIQKSQSLLQQEFDNLENLRKQQEVNELENQKRQQAWHNEFQNLIKSNSDYSNDKKRQLVEEQYAVVKINEDTEVPVWYAKELMIKSKPELYIKYLEWLESSFDLQSGNFKSNVQNNTNTKTTVKRQILDLINKKGNTTSKTNKSNSNKQTFNKNVTVDPLDMI